MASIHLANLRSLQNKTDKLLLISRLNKDFSNSTPLCFTETWLNDAIPDSALHLPNFQLIRSDRDAESTGKSRSFCSFILSSVYILPQEHVSSALQKLTDQITETEQKHPDSVLIILRNLNKANLSCELPKYRQHVTCPTRGSNILDHCYTTIKDAFHSVPQAALGLSDHCLVHLTPTYRQKLKSAKPVLRTVKRWTNETERVLQACLDLTDWTIFEAAATALDELTETVTSFISFCEDMCIPTRTCLTYNNDKPWFTAKFRQPCQAKEDAYRNGNRVLYKQAEYTLEKEIRVAKRYYSLGSNSLPVTQNQCGKV